jgi:glycosyltransferase involved in cell wall biosynthesis
LKQARKERELDQLPQVSVVIPTRDRPALVLRAVRSALAQTLAPIEVIVVIDGPDRATEEALATIADPRVSTVRNASPLGGSEARNAGIRHGRGEFVALLDDDDEWAPDKLQRQVELARKSKKRFPIVTCRLIARRPTGDEIWPARAMRPEESMSEYLLCREASIRQGEGFIQTSTLLAPRALMQEVPFTANLPRHQDWDWLIRAAVHPGVEFLWVWKPLVIYHFDGYRKSVSSAKSLDPSLQWINTNRLVTPKARAYFYATQIAARCHTPAQIVSIILNTLRYPRALLIAMGLMLTPRALVYRFWSRSAESYA